MEVFKLFGSIFIDNEAANKSLDSTSAKSESAGSKISKGLGKVVKTAAAVGTAVVGATTAVVKGGVELAKSTAGNADEIDKMSQKLGMSKQAYQEWDYVLGQAGVEINSMQTGMKTLMNQIGQAQNGSEDATKRFEALGISLEDLNTMSREDIFSAVVSGMQGMEDSTSRAALANKLFGKSGQELTALFNESAESTEQLKKQANDLGLVMSDEAVNAGVNLTDTLDTLSKSGNALKNGIGSALVPVIDKLAQMIIAAIPTIQGLISKLVPILTGLFDTIIPILGTVIDDIFPTIIDLLGALLPVISNIITAILPIVIKLLQQMLPPFIQIVNQILPLVIKLITPLLPLLSPILDLLTPLLNMILALLPPLIDIINQILPPIIALLTTVIKNVLPPLQSAFSAVASVITSVFQSALSNLQPIIENVKGYFQGIIDFVTGVFSGNWTKAWNGIKSIFQNIVSGFGNIIKYPINNIIDGINSFIRSVNKIKIPDWVPGVGGKGLSIGTIPKLKRGIDYVPYDDFPAYLHEGERVLTKEENAQYGSSVSSEYLIELVEELLSIFKGFTGDALIAKIKTALDGMRISYNDRELARLIKEHS